jgi:hypothetical protein
LDDDVADFESFRQSGVDFKVSLSSLDELLSGSGPAGSGSNADWAGLGAVAGLFRGTSLDGSRFSLTGSVDGFGSRRSSRGVGLTSMPRISQQQLLQLRASQQQLEHLLMPPPKNHHSAASHHLGIGVVNVAAWDVAGQPSSSVCHGAGDRCESPFKAAAVQKAPFSPAIGSVAGAAAAGAASVAPSSQPTNCCFSVGASEHSAPDIKQEQQQQQQQQGSPEKLAAAAASQQQQQQQQQPRLPATFHDVLQALQLPGNAAAAKQDAPGALETEQQAANSTAEQPVGQHAAAAVSASAAPEAAPAPAPAAISSLRVQCPTDAEQQQQQQRASMQLLSPVGRLFANRGSMDGCLMLDDPMGMCCFDLSTAVDDSAQTQAERRSLRLLLGALASSDPLSSSWETAANGSTAAAAAGVGASPAADPAAAAAAEELRAIKRESEGQGHGSSSRRNTSSSRLSNGSLVSGGMGLSLSGRTSSRGLSAWYGVSGHGAVSMTASAAAAGERDAALFRRQGRVSGSILAVGGELHKRPRVSLTLTSPRNGAGAKRHRVSYMGSLAVGRPSADATDMDDCLSFWKV